MADRVASGLRVYYDTLCASGVTTYSWEEMNKDFNLGVWHGTMSCLFGGAMVETQMAKL
eukprot:SAG31_NODE_17952_length_652_cov_0.746835_1_plen_58_part_01